jgi:hypothetical protein
VNPADFNEAGHGTRLAAVPNLPPALVAKLHGRWLHSVEDVLGSIHTPAAEEALRRFLELDHEAYSRLLSDLRAAIPPAALGVIDRSPRLRGGLGLRLPDRSGGAAGD